MAYNAIIPQAADLLSQSQAGILGNFTEINNLIDPNTGQLKKALIIDTAADPVTTAAQVGFYQKVGATSAVPELFFRRNTSGAVIPMTEAVKTDPGWTYLPSGIILQWGSMTIPGGNADLNWAMPRAFPTATLSVTATPLSLSAGLNTDMIIAISIFNAKTNLRVQRKTHFGTACSFYWLAIGH